eukprot:3853107-Amphidinium_carterae.1
MNTIDLDPPLLQAETLGHKLTTHQETGEPHPGSILQSWCVMLIQEPVLVNRTGAVTVWADGSGRHSSDPQHRRCGVGYHTDTHEHVWLPLPGLRQYVYRADFLAVVRALEECQPHEVVSDGKGVVKAFQALQTGRRMPKGRNRDL